MTKTTLRYYYLIYIYSISFKDECLIPKVQYSKSCVMQLRRKPHSPKCKRPRKQAFVSEISTRAQCFNKHTPDAISCTKVTLHVYVRATKQLCMEIDPKRSNRHFFRQSTHAGNL